MEIRTTTLSKCLDKKLKIFGFEVVDLLALFLTLSILNFLFGRTDFKVFLVWLPSLTMGLVLYFGKKGKPDNYLIHWLRYQISPFVFSAFQTASRWSPPPRLDRGNDQ